nr:Tn3 family transposase [Enterococcus casseliflavus]
MKKIGQLCTNISLREDLLKHVSPLGWEHINFLGEYNFDASKVASLHSLRPLIQ